jgi:hypothetical protein
LFQVDPSGPMFLFCSHGVKPPFQPALDPYPGEFRAYLVRDANGVTMAWLRDDAQRYGVGASKLTSEEARRIGKAISRIPEFIMQRRGFYPRGGGPRWRADRPYHVALQDQYIREHRSEIDALCRLTARRSIQPARSLTTKVCGGSTSLRGRWTPSCSGIASRGAGCATRSFTIPSGPKTCRP